MQEQALREAVSSNTCMIGVLRSLKLDPRGVNYKRVRAKIEGLKIDTMHWVKPDMGAHLRGRARNILSTIPLEEILVENSSYLNNSRLKTRLVRAGLLENKCYVCFLTSWQGKSLTLQLDHKNGVPNDHRLSNLRLLCPNCHSQTETFCGRNKRSRRDSNP